MKFTFDNGRVGSVTSFAVTGTWIQLVGTDKVWVLGSGRNFDWVVCRWEGGRAGGGTKMKKLENGS